MLATELTSPLATSRSALAMLLAGDLGELNEKQHEYLKRLMELDDFMIGLLASWVDVDRLTKGQVFLDVEACNIGAVVTEHVHASRTTQWPMVLADPLRLKQIIANLLEIFRHAEVRARVVEDMCVLTVHDRAKSNHTLRAEIVEALNSDEPTRQLGLRIARLLAEAHGGSLQLDPHAAGGTKLHLRLPLAKQMSLLY